MGYLKNVWNAQVEVWSEQLGDGCGELSRDRAVDIAKSRRAATIAGHGAQPGTAGRQEPDEDGGWW